KAAAAPPNLHTYDHERHPRDLHFNIDEGIQALAVDNSRICNRKRNAFGFGLIGHSTARSAVGQLCWWISPDWSTTSGVRDPARSTDVYRRPHSLSPPA